LFGDKCDYFCNVLKIYKILEMPEVVQLRSKFSPEICRRITWAIIDDGRSFFNTVITPQEFSTPGMIVFPMSFLHSILESIRFCNPIQRGNFPQEWLASPRRDREGTTRGRQGRDGQGQKTGDGGTGSPGSGGGGRHGFETGRHGGGRTREKREYTGSGGGGGGRRWTPPSPDPRHPRIAEMVNPYLERTNGMIYLPTVLEESNLSMEDLPTLDRFHNAVTGRTNMCWSQVLGPCPYRDCYFASRGGHPARDDYTDEFVDKVVAILGPAFKTRMQNMSNGGVKKIKTEQSPTA